MSTAAPLDLTTGLIVVSTKSDTQVLANLGKGRNGTACFPNPFIVLEGTAWFRDDRSRKPFLSIDGVSQTQSKNK